MTPRERELAEWTAQRDELERQRQQFGKAFMEADARGQINVREGLRADLATVTRRLRAVEERLGVRR